MRGIIPALALAFLASSASAQDAPFCLVDSTGTRCWYHDLPSCQRDAQAAGGGCVVNNQRRDQSSAGAGSSGNWWGNAMRSYEAGRTAREDREARGNAQAHEERDAVWTNFCERMQQNDFAMLEALAPRLTTEEYAAATRNYVNRANYCRSLVQ